MRRALVSGAIFVGLLTPACWAGTTIYVNGTTGDDGWTGLCEVWDGGTCGPKKTIQAGINGAGAGDTVMVADGTYTGAGNRDIDFLGRRVTLRSANGAAACTVDCEQQGRGFYFHTAETAATVVDGLTIRNGLVTSSSPGSGYGGGVYSDYATSPTLTNCTIAKCTAAYSGAGVYCYYSNLSLTNCRIEENAAAAGGGGVYAYASAPTMSDCTIIRNTAVEGGGVHWNTSSATLTNCTIADNSAADSGAGAYCYDSGPTLTNCTITSNAAVSSGGGVHCYNSSPTLTNCILWADTPQEVSVSSGSPVVAYCDVQGGYAGAGNRNVDPAFAFAGDFHLLAGSPCIDAGTNTPTGGLPAKDADGNTRPLDGNGDGQVAADMGAYEFSPILPTIALTPTRIEFFIPEGQSSPQTQTLSVRNASGGTLSWTLDWPAAWLEADPVQGVSTGEVDTVTLTADASTLSYGTHSTIVTVSAPQASNTPRFVEVVLHVGTTLHVPSEYATIQAAIDAALPGDEVLVADGTYTGAGNRNLDFHGKPISLRSASGDPATCIIDCQAGDRGFYFHSGETAATVVSGFTVRNGNSDYGAGVYCYWSSPTLTNCTISGNAADRGGGIYCMGSATIANCTISANTAGYGGGGVYCENGSPLISDCTITWNTTSYAGGGIYSGGSSTITNCTINGNTASAAAGGIYCNGVSSLIAGSTISGNSASQGAGIYCSNGSAAITDCTISANLNGKGVYCANSATALISGGAVTGNQGGGIWCGAGLTIADCPVTNNVGDGIYCAGVLAMTNATVTNNQGRGVSCAGALNITNGTITDNGDNGISCGNNSTITGGAVRRNGKAGISCGTGTTIAGCPVEDNQSDGVYSSGSLAVTDCIVMGNQGVGISCTTGTMDHCTVANSKGTGVVCPSGGATVSDCTVSDNQGGGVACVGGTVSGSSVQRNQGTGLACGSGAVTISDCTVSDNTAPGDGGGIACGTGTITDCTVSGNVAVGRGGGVFGSASLIRSTITANEARSGGGIYCSGGSPIVEHCVVVSNVASGIFAGEGTGGGIHCQGASPTLINCLLARNIAANDGGGVYAGRAALASCTVVGNTAVFLGGGLCVNTGTDYRTDARNCVFWGNSGCAGTQFAAIGPAELRVAYSDAQGGPDAVYLHEGAELLWGWGNLETDPVFRDPQTDDYRLGPGSPCVDAGDNFGALTELDLDANPRRVDQPNVPDTGLGEPPIVDMGAFEMQVRLVTQPGDANCDGGVDFDDIGPFVAALIGQTTYEAAYPKCAWLNADCNGDGAVDFDDISPFVKCLVNGGCP